MMMGIMNIRLESPNFNNLLLPGIKGQINIIGIRAKLYKQFIVKVVK